MAKGQDQNMGRAIKKAATMKNYDPDEKSKYITYLDANNLYGWGMSQKLPYTDFKWVAEKKFVGLNPLHINADEDTGYIMQVDPEYPNELHEVHNDYPLAPENITINKIDKSAPNLNNKAKYTLHLKNLQLYLELR